MSFEPDEVLYSVNAVLGQGEFKKILSNNELQTHSKFSEEVTDSNF